MSELDVSQALYSIEAAIAGRRASSVIPAPRPLRREEWPPDYNSVLAWRQQQLARFEQASDYLADAVAYYSQPTAEACAAFICGWCDTYDPRVAMKGRSTWVPLVMFQRQVELVDFIFACMEGDAAGMVEKARDMGATWVAISVTNWLYLFQSGVAVGWGSNKDAQVDILGDMDSIFERIRRQLLRIPTAFRPELVEGVDLKFKVCHNPVNGAVVRGQGGKNIGRGGRSRVYFVDEAAHLDKPASAEAALSENTRCRIDISSVSGLGTIFHQSRESGEEWAPGKPVRRDVTNIFVMDWRDHPEKTQEWYNTRRAFFKSKGQLHVVAREIDRDYAAATEGVIIEHEWVQAAVDAHRVLNFDDAGGWWGGLDVADGGTDSNALVRGRGVVVKYAEDWGERDPGATARRAFAACRETQPIRLEYDCIGLGTNVKSEFNRLTGSAPGDAHVKMGWLDLSPWNAGGAVVRPLDRIGKLPSGQPDPKSMRNKDYFSNIKAQAWWDAGRAFYRTWQLVEAHRAGTLQVEQGAGEPVYVIYDESGNELRCGPGDLISLDSQTIEKSTLSRLMKELSQATMGQNTRMQAVVDKAPDGAKSPNLADGLIMGRWPAPRASQARSSMFGPKIFTSGGR